MSFSVSKSNARAKVDSADASSKTYGGTEADHILSLVQTSDGGYALAGYTWSYGAISGDFWLVKTDSSGNQLWSKTYRGVNNDEAYSLVQTSDGGYALAGRTWSYSTDWSDFWLVKTDLAGNMQWNKTYGGIFNDGAYSLVQTSDGGYALAGYALRYGGIDSDFLLVKTDGAGLVPEFPSLFAVSAVAASTLFAVILTKKKTAKITHSARFYVLR